MEVIVRAGEESDVPDILRLVRNHAKEDYNFDIEENSVEKMRKEFDFFRSVVAEVDQKIIGMAIYSFTYRTWRGQGIYFDDIFVEKSYRKQGIGTQLMEFMLNDAKNVGIDRIYWMTSENNVKGRALYEKIGANIMPGKCDCNIGIKK